MTPPKLAGPVVISAELAADSSPAALQVVGDGLVRDLARKADAAFFANTTTNGPAGLLSIASTAVDAGDAWPIWIGPKRRSPMRNSTTRL